jgi:hypothetical protein
MYVHAQPGVNLEPFVDKTVELRGTLNYRGDCRTNYMRAACVTPLGP